MDWHKLSPTLALERLESSLSGLDNAEASKRLAEIGKNTLPEPKPDHLFTIFLRQFASPIIYILLGATSIVIFIGDIIDASIIMAVLLVNAIVGSIQEGKAQNTLDALRKMVRTNAYVLRSGRETVISSEEVVPGDIIILKEGDKVPADARVIESRSLLTDESALTGESTPVDKFSETIDKDDIPAPDRQNMVFRGTYVVRGEAKALVTSTGTKTIIGGISKKLETLDTDVPLKVEIRKLSRFVITVVLSLSSLIFAIGLLRGNGLEEMFSTAVAIAVSATPEGLPVVVTIVLAAGVYRMSKQNALVRRLQAVEALGQAKVIALDKTGTITLNQMAAERIYVSGEAFEVDPHGYEPKGAISRSGMAIDPLDHPNLILIGKIAALCVNANVAYSEESKEWNHVSGDPTEAALLVLSKKIGFSKDVLEQEYKKIFEEPFNSGTRYRAVLHESGGAQILSVIGAPEAVIESCSTLWQNGKQSQMSHRDRNFIDQAMAHMSKQGLRVVALAKKSDTTIAFSSGNLKDLCFVGLVGMSDSIRSDVRGALEKAAAAGVKIVMITGDYPETAKAIARKVSIYKDGDDAITGKELSSLSESELGRRLRTTTVFARVVPEDKLKIIEAYRREGIVVAMTGDGVNDALPLAAADLGVAMGRIGTEVAKEAADIVLLDDNFGSIVSAIEEGRQVYRSIKKIILYLFSTSMGEILTITAAILIGYPVPLLASQIIWMNFVTDGFLVVALGLEPKGDSTLSPKAKRIRLFDRLLIFRITTISVAMMTVSLYLFHTYLDQGFVKASTVALTTLVVCQWFNTLNVRSNSNSVFRSGKFKNPYLLWAFFVVISLQLLAIYSAPLQKILHTVPLELVDWGIIVGMSTLVILVEEARKGIARIVTID